MSDMNSTLLREILDYNQDTGIFHWKIRPCKNKPIGFLAGCKDGQGYCQIIYKGKRYFSHRLAWLYVYGDWPSLGLDHINGDRADNRICNLREATPAENMQNFRRANKLSHSGVLGIHWDKQKQRWRARIRVNGKRKNLGRFLTKEDAYQAYIEAKRQFHPFGTL